MPRQYRTVLLTSLLHPRSETSAKYLFSFDIYHLTQSHGWVFMPSLRIVTAMNDSEVLMNPNELVQFLKKNPADFTKDDIIRFCEENGIEMVNFRYVAGDGKLKTLNFVISSKEYLDTILSDGERVDGSNIFPFIEAGSSAGSGAPGQDPPNWAESIM